ncbi:MAG: S-layer homology domain-containing protein [Clostridia bacterium]|nr:S-layer homology domain-containing protein [Clostridia bacterium]
MNKKIFTLALTLLLALLMVPMVWAAEEEEDEGLKMPEDKIDVTAGIGVIINGDSEWPESEPGDEPKLTIPSNMEDVSIDVRVELYMESVIGFIEEWYEYGVDMICLATGGETPSEQDLEFRESLLDFFNFLPVQGTFTVTLKSSQTIGIPEEYTQLGEMEGFNDEARDLFVETDRTFNGKTLTIKLAIREDVTMGELMENREAYFSQMSLTMEGIDISQVSETCRLQGRLKGSVVFQAGIEENDKHTVRLETDTLEAKLIKEERSYDDVEEEPIVQDKKITFNIDGDTELIEPMYAFGTIDAGELPIPTKIGAEFDGWYTDTKMTKKVEDTLRVSKNMTLYGHWIDTTPLETDAHYAYIFGYPNGTICPDNNITREEVSMIFYRLLKDDVRTELLTQTNGFSDVAEDRWSNQAISTMVRGEFIRGRSKTEFNPEAFITRAELVTMATRFVALTDVSEVQFTDLTGHWAEEYVQKATAAGWISGYPDGTFKPDAYVTRAEAMALINRMLSRSVDEAGIHADAKIWSDITPGDWRYSVVIEATNSHTYTRSQDGKTEIWSAIIENKTWD